MPRSGTSTRCLGREESSFRGYPFDDGKQVFGEQGSLLQTAVAMGLMMIYIPVLIKLQPYKLPSDNGVA